jgi:serine phosphatase RsbU (regulator of sigma subunit)
LSVSDSVARSGVNNGTLKGLQFLGLARALGQALTPDEVAEAVFDHVIASLGAETVGLWLLDDNEVIRFVGGAGPGGPGGPRAVGEMPLDADIPAAIAVRTAAMVTYSSTAERNARWPALTGLRSASEAVAVVPLIARGRTIGALHLGWPDVHESAQGDAELLAVVADLCATSLDRAQLYERERTFRQTLEFLNQGARLMVSALDPQQIVRALVGLAVPWLAPWCAVYVAEEGKLVRVAVEIDSDPGLADELLMQAPVPIDADIPLAEAYRTGQPAVLKGVPATVADRTYPSDQARKVLSMAGGRTWSAMVLPVQAGGEVIGVMSLVSSGWNERPAEEVFFAAEGLAARAGVALHNARLYREQVNNVSTLTAALLPDRVPRLDGLRFAARYLPASGGVCGDWYETEVLPDGRVLVGIGDASGHGLTAAATMARVRHAARGLAVAGIGPGRMLEHLSHLLTGSGEDDIATAVYGIIDPRLGAGTWANAGHPPPILLDPAGDATTLLLPPGPPIGSGDVFHTETTWSLPASARLILYTDGLFERRGEDPAVGIGRLIELITGMVSASEDEIAEAVIKNRSGADDACVLVIGR